MRTAVSKPVLGTVALYPHTEERQAKNGQIWLHQKFCQDLKKKKKNLYRNGNSDSSNKKEKVRDKPKIPSHKVRQLFRDQSKNRCFIWYKSER